MGSRITDEEVARFREDGFLIKERLFTPEEMSLVRRVVDADDRKLESHGRGGARQEGRRSELWTIGGHGRPRAAGDLDNDNLVYDALCYCERMISAQQRLLLDRDQWPGDELTLHHRKFILKDEESYLPPDKDEAGQHGGNGFQWHQDYWYWGDYSNTGLDAYGGPGRPYPDLLIALIAIDRHHRDNGCLQVIRGSHHHRIKFRAEQWGERHALPEEVDRLLAQGHERVWCEMEPGSVVFFSPETLHQSFPNPTRDPRWAFICCFDTMHNVPNDLPNDISKKGADWRVPAPVWDDALVTEYGRQQLERLTAH
jgi:hypothetical protein